MNKIKNFLGVAVLSMAIAGAFATKNTRWNAQSFYYVFNTSTQTCNLVNEPSPSYCSFNGTGCTDSNGFQIYFDRNGITLECEKPAKRIN